MLSGSICSNVSLVLTIFQRIYSHAPPNRVSVKDTTYTWVVPLDYSTTVLLSPSCVWKHKYSPLCYSCLQYSVQSRAVQVCSPGATGCAIGLGGY